MNSIHDVHADHDIQYFVCGVSVISYCDQDLQIPTVKGESGEYAAMVKEWLMDIMYGKEEHEWGVVVEEREDV